MLLWLRPPPCLLSGASSRSAPLCSSVGGRNTASPYPKRSRQGCLRSRSPLLQPPPTLLQVQVSPSLPIHVACRSVANHKAAFTKQQLLMEIQGWRREEGAGMGPHPYHPLQPSLDGDLRPAPPHTSQLSGRTAGCQ